MNPFKQIERNTLVFWGQTLTNRGQEKGLAINKTSFQLDRYFLTPKIAQLIFSKKLSRKLHHSNISASLNQMAREGYLVKNPKYEISELGKTLINGLASTDQTFKAEIKKEYYINAYKKLFEKAYYLNQLRLSDLEYRLTEKRQINILFRLLHMGKWGWHRFKFSDADLFELSKLKSFVRKTRKEHEKLLKLVESRAELRLKRLNSKRRSKKRIDVKEIDRAFKF